MTKLCDVVDAGSDAFDRARGFAPKADRWQAEQAIRRLYPLLETLYGEDERFSDDFIFLCTRLGRFAHVRPASLRARDQQRAKRPNWFIEDRLVGYAAYVDRFAGTLHGVRQRIPHLKRLGVTYLHLLPFLRSRDGDNDGGFAVCGFDQVEPALGTMADLEILCADLHDSDIALCSDFVLNHVADDHPWALAAAAGDPRYRAFFHVFNDRRECDAYEASLGQVFPDAAPGNFTHVQALDGWVWTTFYPYQWDLNYAHFPVFVAMTEAMLNLANHGIDVFRLDSAPFLWKRRGTSCTNQPEVHVILQALRAIVELVAPGVLLKAEAVMPPKKAARYLGDDQRPECHLAYHSGLMAAAWGALVEQRATLVEAVMHAVPSLPSGAGWMTYVRCHDDIVWSVLKDDLPAAGHPFSERIGLVADFLEGATPASYARGVPFQRGHAGTLHGTNGMAAALVGLPADTPAARRLALDRLLLLYGLACWAGAIPLIFMGDELAQGNNDDPRDTAAAAVDSRWFGRPRFDDALACAAERGEGLCAEAFSGLRALLSARADPRFDPLAPTTAMPSGHPAVLALRRGETARALFNFSEQAIALDTLAVPHDAGCHVAYGQSDGMLAPYGMLWTTSP